MNHPVKVERHTGTFFYDQKEFLKRYIELSKSNKYRVVTVFETDNIGFTKNKLHDGGAKKCEVYVENIRVIVRVEKMSSRANPTSYECVAIANLYPRIDDVGQTEYFLMTHYESGRDGYKSDLQFIDGLARITAWAKKYIMQ